eukprot:TRINITY_DN108398_c0_g1_i1.p1 TRINITY_DN108398_c0_g1~~TRINITY_DN108398_c0_g1_i1.p1  ORF type:complete len:234 (-),score=44.83 TRINITY_DN108398_c0_g1_i1:257-958(-)
MLGYTMAAAAASEDRSFKAILFDFDATLTVVPEIPRHRIYPGFDSQAPDVAWLQNVAFGGEARLQTLLQTLHMLRDRWRAELFIVSFAEKDTIVRTLTLLDALTFFGAQNIFGWQEMGGPFTRKGEFVLQFMQDKGLQRTDVLFLDDQADNIRSVEPACVCYWVRGGKGLTDEELQKLQRDSGLQLAQGSSFDAMNHSCQDVASDRTNRSSRSSVRSQLSSLDGALEQGASMV